VSFLLVTLREVIAVGNTEPNMVLVCAECTAVEDRCRSSQSIVQWVDDTGSDRGVSRVCSVYGLVAEVNNSDVSVQTREQLSVINHSVSTWYQEISDFHSGLELFFTHRGLQNVYVPALKVLYSKWQIDEYIRTFVRISMRQVEGVHRCEAVLILLLAHN
jgi:hypothetical protein